ncbi:nuclear transport factor 2 family protein [Haliea sp. E1-2-M8]|uniref:nuclear transport factor 2 family protein n=1 Tax=Haliea sp. E1-2-M8 TaxID=3064706 RepID=UPI0027230EFC|nr:nuclear transport factor 2 family protein [Haliea sp. E1-2-M8]MDO8861953.1 nuclear transport factor 2 family protein [Haliea sp. E1-2-M8]
MARSEHLAAVQVVIQSYVDACGRGDVLALRALFHPSAIMSGYLAGELVTGSPEPFFTAVGANPAPVASGLRYDARIDTVHMDGRIATAVLRETGYLGMDFVNHFQLLEIDGQWHIVAKLFESL